VDKHLSEVCDDDASNEELSTEAYILAFEGAIGAGATPIQARKIAEKISSSVVACNDM
jgi:hypothetical protein